MVHIAIPGTGGRTFTYRLPEPLAGNLQPGQRCRVPFGRRRLIGFYVGPAASPPSARLKEIDQPVEPVSLFGDELYRFLQWMAEYYLAGLGDVLTAAIPPWLRRAGQPSFIVTERFPSVAARMNLPDKIAPPRPPGTVLDHRQLTTLATLSNGLVDRLVQEGALSLDWIGSAPPPRGQLRGYHLNQKNTPDQWQRIILDKFENPAGPLTKSCLKAAGLTEYRIRKMIAEGSLVAEYGLPESIAYIKPRPGVDSIVPSNQQQAAIETILGERDNFAPFLLYGITGSGKTLVYCHITREIYRQGKSVLVLVPEIALAGTLLSYFQSFFGDRVALLHSALSPRERAAVWQNIASGRYRIVIGARSAIFAPLRDPGLIIVDEEHDESYKQDDPAPRFQARDAAVMRAKMAGIPVVLGSATPAVESFHNARSGRYRLLKLTRRPERSATPVVRLIDLRDEWPVAGIPFLTATLRRKIDDALGHDRQVILYLNRRGFSPRIKCTSCGHTPQCPHCRISLTYHRSGNKLMCHFCGYVNAAYDTCEKCQGEKFVYLGTGTQKIEEHLTGAFGGAHLVRLDSDSAGRRTNASKILSEFAAGQYNILLGTQMVTKGIDFPRVTLVGVLMADIGLDMPDFRASEKLFAKLIQVAGRSGRGIEPGEVVIQTFHPRLDLIDDAARQDYDTFYEREIESRRALGYPPFAHLVNFRLSAKKEESVKDQSLHFRRQLEKRLARTDLRVQLLGPAPCPLYRLRGLFRRHLFARTRAIRKLTTLLHHWQTDQPDFGLPSSIRLAIDIDPYDMM